MEEHPPERKTSEEERFQDDYYSYFESPENAQRYKPAVYFLNDTFNCQPYSLLDLGCGNGALTNYLPEYCNYLGVDHSELAIKHCLKLYPNRANRNFIAKDLSILLPDLVAENRKFDAVVLAGLLFHSTDKESLERKDDQEIIQFCLDKLLSDRGYLVIIVPFAYGNHPAHSLFARSEWLQKSVEPMLETAKAKIVFENLSLLIGLEQRVRQQQTTPDWFIPDSEADYPNKYAGTYMASWTFIASPQAG